MSNILPTGISWQDQVTLWWDNDIFTSRSPQRIRFFYYLIIIFIRIARFFLNYFLMFRSCLFSPAINHSIDRSIIRNFYHDVSCYSHCALPDQWLTPPFFVLEMSKLNITPHENKGSWNLRDVRKNFYGYSSSPLIRPPLVSGQNSDALK